MSLFHQFHMGLFYYTASWRTHRSPTPSLGNGDDVALASHICRAMRRALGSSVLAERVKHGWPLLASLWGWVLGLEWKLNVKIASWQQMSFSLGFEYLCLLRWWLPATLAVVTQNAAGAGRKKTLCRVRFSFTSSLGSFLPCWELPLSSDWKGTWGESGEGTRPEVIYNRRQLDHFIPKRYFLKISSFIPEVFLME